MQDKHQQTRSSFADVTSKFLNTSTSKYEISSFLPKQNENIINDNKKSHTQNDTKNKSLTRKIRKNSQSQNLQIYKRYSEFMNEQGNIITQIILEGRGQSRERDSKYSSNINLNNSQQEMVNKLHNSSSSFIKTILKQLCQLYQKHRVLKQTYRHDTQALIMQLQSLQSTKSLLQKQHDYTLFACQKQSSSYISQLRNQLKNTIEQYEQKLQVSYNGIREKQEHNDRIYGQKLELNNKLTQVNRILNLQREQANEKYREYQGLTKLVQQYQKNIQEYQEKLASLESEKQKMQLKLMQIQQYNNELVEQLDQMQAKMKSKEQQIQKVNIALEQSRANNIRYMQQSRSQKQQLQTKAKSAQSKIIEHQHKQLCQKLDIESMRKKNQLLIQEVELLKAKIQINKQQVKKSKVESKVIVDKVQKMCKQKQRRLNKLFICKVNNLKTQNRQLKSYVQRQMLQFYHQLKIDILMNSNVRS